MLKLDETQILNALGLCGTQAAGLLESDHAGSMGKVLHVGKANYNGILSAFLARNGFTGAETIIEGSEGITNAAGVGAKDDYYYVVAPKSIKATTMAGLGVIAQDGDKTGTDTYTVALMQAKTGAAQVTTDTVVSTKDVKVTVSNGKFASYTATLVNPTLKTVKTNLYTGQAATDSAILAVTAKDTAGNVVDLLGGESGSYIAVLRTDKVDDAVLELDKSLMAGNSGAYTLVCKTKVDGITKHGDGTAYVDIYAPTLSGDIDLVATVEVECSDDDPTPLMFVGTKISHTGKATAYDISQGIAVPSDFKIFETPAGVVIGTGIPIGPGTLPPAGTYAYSIAAVDQYGMTSVDEALYNGVDVTMAGKTVGEAGGSLSIASGAISTMVSVAGLV